MVGPRDRVGVATLDNEHGFQLLSAFTTDRRLIVAAIKNPRSFHGFDPLQVAGTNPMEDVAGDLTPAPGGDALGISADFKDILRGSARLEDDYARAKIDRQVMSLTGLATTLRAVAGQKHIVFLSEGFESRLIQGRDARGGQAEKGEENTAVEAGQTWKVNNDDRYGSSSSMSLITRLSEAARRSDVILDAVDIHGLRSDIDARKGTVQKSNEGLHLLAGSTGGTVFQNSNDLASDFGRVLKSQEFVYILGFQTTADKPGKFHALKVHVNVPGARVTARTGYYEGAGANVLERALSSAEVMINDIPQDAIRVESLAAPFPTTAVSSQVPVILEVNGQDLAGAVGTARRGTAEIYVYAFDEDGLVRDSTYQRLTFDLAKLGDSLKNGIKYYATLSLPPGRYAIKSLVNVAETAKKGFVRKDIVVPANGDVAISQPLFLEEPGKWLMVRGSSHDKTNAGYPFVVNGQAFIPSAGVSVHRGEPRTFAVFVENASPDELSVESSPKTTVVSQTGSGLRSLLLLRLDSADPSTAALDVTVRKRGSDDLRKSSIPLTIQ
ncbi:MAG TPA: VWA domain-containing protein, partial [Thermoanaerobaculia bacterium]|jgi:VWFA-related protein|nr:VWA domain-containing protein [Thermoanaerobaculia bacterium]